MSLRLTIITLVPRKKESQTVEAHGIALTETAVAGRVLVGAVLWILLATGPDPAPGPKQKYTGRSLAVSTLMLTIKKT
ncbi:hypothetical protein BDV26DRAFT_198446 [Aspergillus bertholletiae]|uniref:Uncharacterized protein n=1 Tax=Aspergillus bertholletiae TaxID=1226010 RepID=A0A5N7B8L0_9EURO|nr:hypothetical protein BDV26DRAFT_198446 [Aspergillus bertholletiae]